jgi:phosphatidylglycerol:prolipoprotein diacylglycerol transferase
MVTRLHVEHFVGLHGRRLYHCRSGGRSSIAGEVIGDSFFVQRAILSAMHPILVQWGNLTIGSYAALLDLGLVAAIAIVWLEARRLGLRLAIWLDVVLVTIVIGALSARLGYALINWAYFKDHLAEVFQIWQGGLAWQAGLIGGSIAAWLMARRQAEFAPLQVLDVLSIAAPLGIALGWIGCYLSAAAYGREMFPSQPLYFLSIDAPDLYGLTNPRWPSQLLGTLWSLIVFGLLWLTRRKNWQAGTRFWLFVASYSLGAFLIGFTRADDVPILAGWRLDQILDAGLTIAGLIGLVLITQSSQAASDPAT